MVYRALIEGPEGFERQVVLKRILPSLSKEPRFTKMLLAEARLCGLLHHANIVAVNDVGEVDGEYFLAMEYVGGFDLSTVLMRCHDLERPFPPGLACHVAAELASALAYAHALADDAGRPLEVVHRDVSPSNVMLTSEGAVKLLDFGIAKIRNELRDERTRTGTLKGKLGYMSPEQADGAPIDKRTDIFALGIVLWECLTLERLFSGGDDLETLRKVREARVWPPSSVRPEIEPEVDAVVLRMLVRSAEARYQSCDEVVAALSPIAHRHQADAAALKKFLAELGPLDGQRLQSLPLDATTPAKKASQPREQTSQPHQPSVSNVATAPPPPRRRTPKIVAAALLLGALLGVVAWWARPTPATTTTTKIKREQPTTPADDAPDPPPPLLPARAADHPWRLAVVQYKNLGGDRDLELLSEGIGDTLATALGGLHSRLRLVERNQIDKALKEIDLGQSKYADQQTAVALGKITGAELVILGGFQRDGDRVRVSTRLVSSESGEVIDSIKLTRPAGNLFAVQDAVAARVQARLDAMLGAAK